MPTISAADKFFEEYEGKLKTAERMAFISTVMYGFNWFLGFCALTWASAVILGGLLTSLTQHDYYSVTALLLLEAVRLSATTFFGKFVTQKLVHGSADPQRLVYNDATRQQVQGIARMVEQALMLTVFAFSILVPIRRLQDLNVLAATIDTSPHPSQASASNSFDGMETSLRIFYVLVLINGAIAGLAVIFSKNVVPFFVDSFSLRKYYEKIVWKGMDEGLLHATDFEFLAWTFQMQADEYRRNVRALVVRDLYGDLMKFLYCHPRHKGFEAAKVALESEDTYEREAAANIVGLWVKLVSEMAQNGPYVGDTGAPCADMNARHMLGRMLMQEKLLTKLAEVLDNDESGRAASSSFYALAKSDLGGLLKVRIGEKDEKVAGMLMDCIHRTVELGRPKNALLYIKAMIPLSAHLREEGELLRSSRIGEYCAEEKLRRLREDMWRIVSEYERGLKRLQVVAAHVYMLLSSKEELDKANRGYEDLRGHLNKETEEQGTHMLEEEQESLLYVLGKKEFPAAWKGAVKRRPMKAQTPRPLPWLARPTTAWIATFLSVAVLVVSSIFISKRGHF